MRELSEESKKARETLKRLNIRFTLLSVLTIGYINSHNDEEILFEANKYPLPIYDDSKIMTECTEL